ncbi:hypothetical protein CDAR_592621 [Caerostris darwini]|uniref:Uncharacterized protein n=1 Tax=Caerostris darwini TaxID=1538125 RepID=A0AAV4QJF8_9ARAC|nr:hypothetical protein CDAR_592621 [Caerostris darwini]
MITNQIGWKLLVEKFPNCYHVTELMSFQKRASRGGSILRTKMDHQSEKSNFHQERHINSLEGHRVLRKRITSTDVGRKRSLSCSSPAHQIMPHS